MRVLAIETSTKDATVALADGEGPNSQLLMPDTDRTASWLAGAIDEALRDRQWDRQSISLIALTSGPGSFTGLRIGVTTAKMLSYALQIPIVELDTLEVIAYQAPPADGTSRVAVIMDARRGDLFAALFETSSDGTMQQIEATQLVAKSDWLEIASATSPLLVTGPAAVAVQEQLPLTAQVTAPETWSPRAATVACLALGDRETVSAMNLEPKYYRKSYAEK